MTKRIALKAIELGAVAVLVVAIYFIAEAPLRLAEYRLMGRD